MPKTKEEWLHFAEIVDALRIFPRLLLLVDFLFTCWYCWYAIDSVITLIKINAVHDSATVNLVNGVAAVFISGTIPFITYRFGKVADIYLKTGRVWGEVSE